MFLCLKDPTAPPSNRLARSPHIAEMIDLYSQVRNLGALPDEGALLDQRADYYAYFRIFGGVEAEVRFRQTQQR